MPAITPSAQTVNGTVKKPITDTEAYVASDFAKAPTFSITPTLPKGLVLDPDTGVVSGTPTAVQKSIEYTVTATAGKDEASATIVIVVDKAGPAQVTALTSTITAIADEEMTDTDPLKTDGFTNDVTFSVVPDLPKGLSLDTVTGVISGTPLLAQMATDYLVTGDDGVDSASVTLTIIVKAALTPLLDTVGATVDTEIVPTEPVPHGFADPVTYSLDPESDPIPEGLVFDPDTGVVSGTAITAQLTTTSTLVATDGTFTAKSTIEFTISCEDAAALAPECGVPGPPDMALQQVGPLASLMSTTPDPIHGPYSMTTGTCAGCHRMHSGKQTEWLGLAAQTSTELCFSCHNGTGAAPNVAVEYQGAATNNPVTRTYFQHDPTNVGTHTAFYADDAGDSFPSDEFAGVLNRQSACVDCHNPHSASTTEPTETATGWTAAGSNQGASGVKVTNGAAGSAPTYELVGATLGPINRGYQLCFKCHSGYTKLDNAGFETKPSLWWLDKGLELNPANASFHPIEAAGKNTTAKMALSLSGTSPYKLWDMSPTSTVRCENCHATNAVNDTPGATQNPGQLSPNHVSTNAGILIRNYRGQKLNTRPSSNSPQNYIDGDYALCFTCHTNTPYLPVGGSTLATNFRYHRLHVSGIYNQGTVNKGTNINKDGDGAGNAICAECHFRLHSTATELNAATRSQNQALDGRRLVSFSPNVQPDQNGRLEYVIGSNGTVSCYLLCHGQDHSPKTYTP